jgi:hypothetical protein
MRPCGVLRRLQTPDEAHALPPTFFQLLNFRDNNDLPRALEALRIVDVWQEAYHAGVLTEPPPTREGLVKSPFRDEGRKGSFSICHGGRGYFDHGGAGQGAQRSGNVWKFHEACYPSMEKRDRARALIALAAKLGLIVPAAPASGAGRGPAETVQAVVVDESGKPRVEAVVSPELTAAAKALVRRQKAQEAEDEVYRARERELHPRIAAPLPAWPEFVAKHFAEGIAHLRTPAGEKRLAELAAARGWPECWVRALVDRELFSFPWERWAAPGAKGAGRNRAFVVQVPRPAGLGRVALEPVGYHQLFYQFGRDGAPPEKKWLYVPSLPQWRARSALEEQLVAYAEKERGMTLEQKRPLVAPLPFVLGDLEAPRTIVLLEGQWDAITFFGACGWFFDDDRCDPLPEQGCAIFGIRGAQGIDAFLSYWGEWLYRHQPRAWCIADNDAAGGTWREAPPAQPGLPRPPGLAEKLEAAGCRKGATLMTWLKPGPWGKDFNDYYRAARPTPAKMREWLQRVGVLDAKGGWA